MVDFSQPIQTIDGDTAELLRSINSRYGNVVLVTDEYGTERVYNVSDGGDTESMIGFIENVVAKPEPEFEDEQPPLYPVITLPERLNIRVNHSRRGSGRLVKVRVPPKGKEGKTLGIRLYNNDVEGDDGILWAYDKYVTLQENVEFND